MICGSPVTENTESRILRAQRHEQFRELEWSSFFRRVVKRKIEFDCVSIVCIPEEDELRARKKMFVGVMVQILTENLL